MLGGTAKTLPLAILGILGIIGVTVALSYALDTDGARETPISVLATKDFPVPKDLDDLARRSDYILRGTVIKEDSTSVRDPSEKRGTVFNQVVISTIRVDEVMKGTLQESQQITLGQDGIEFEPPLPDGSQLVLFLGGKVSHSVPRHSKPYDYFSSAGPQGMFLIDFDSDKTTPLGHRIAPITELYQGASVSQFLEEVRQAAARNPEPRPRLQR